MRGRGRLSGGWYKNKNTNRGQRADQKKGVYATSEGTLITRGVGVTAYQNALGKYFDAFKFGCIDIILCTIFNINIIHINELINYFVYLLCKEPLASSFPLCL